MDWLIIYLFFGIVWSINAARKQVKYFGVNSNFPIAIILNLVLWPFGIIFAFINRNKF